jgi:hypothetical protein
MSNSSETQGKRPLLSDRYYTILKHISAIGLPSVGALYFALASLWHLPNAEQVVGSIAAVNVFMGGLMGVSQASYNASDAKYAGDLLVGQTEDGFKTIQVAMNSEAAAHALDTQTDAKFKVVPGTIPQ